LTQTENFANLCGERFRSFPGVFTVPPDHFFSRPVLDVRKPPVTFSIVPRDGHIHGPLGICGHTIFSAHHIMASADGAPPLAVGDSSQKLERQRNESGVRRHGWFGSWFGLSPHRCDSCKRKKELEQTLVCPYCCQSIIPGMLVHVVPTKGLAAVTRMKHVATTTADDEHLVICENCSTMTASKHPLLWRWNGHVLRAVPQHDDLESLFL
jgi:hypothetical protein